MEPWHGAAEGMVLVWRFANALYFVMNIPRSARWMCYSAQKHDHSATWMGWSVCSYLLRGEEGEEEFGNLWREESVREGLSRCFWQRHLETHHRTHGQWRERLFRLNTFLSVSLFILHFLFQLTCYRCSFLDLLFCEKTRVKREQLKKEQCKS